MLQLCTLQINCNFVTLSTEADHHEFLQRNKIVYPCKVDYSLRPFLEQRSLLNFFMIEQWVALISREASMHDSKSDILDASHKIHLISNSAKSARIKDSGQILHFEQVWGIDLSVAKNCGEYSFLNYNYIKLLLLALLDRVPKQIQCLETFLVPLLKICDMQIRCCADVPLINRGYQCPRLFERTYSWLGQSTTL